VSFLAFLWGLGGLVGFGVMGWWVDVVSAKRSINFRYRHVSCMTRIRYLWRNIYFRSCDASHSRASPRVGVAWSAANGFGSSLLDHHGTSERM